MTRLGKIAHLPCALREQLNLRILDGEPAALLVAWRNTLPSLHPLALTL